ncbi:hypothetical protein ACFS3C_07830 [Azotobacter vinelandii]
MRYGSVFLSARGGAIRSILYALRHHTVEIRFIPEWDDIRLFNHRISHIAGLYTLDLSFSPMNGPARLIKRLEDLLIAIPVMVLILPLCLLIGLAVKLTSRGGLCCSSSTAPASTASASRSTSSARWWCTGRRTAR